MRNIFTKTLAILLASCSWGFSQLAWDRKLLEFQPSVMDTNVVARFSFRNTGSYPITITSIKTTCDCTIPNSEKKTYQAGEKGEITAIFPIEEHAEPQEKTVHVHTSDPKQRMTELKFRVRIPELLKTIPRVLHWKMGEPSEPKTMSIKIVADVPVTVADVHPNDASFKAQLVTVKAGEEYSVTVTPSDTSKAGLAVLRIETILTGQKTRICYGYALIK